jgi:hypothetical protein
MGWNLFFICVIALGLLQVVSYHLLIQRLFRWHRPDWLKAGRAIAGFASSIWSEAPWLKGSIAGHRYYWELIINTPGWVDNDERAYLYLAAFRIGVIGFASGIVGFVISAFLLS